MEDRRKIRPHEVDLWFESDGGTEKRRPDPLFFARNDEMEVIGQQYPGVVEAPAEATDDLAEEGEEGPRDRRRCGRWLCARCHGGEVVDGAGIFDAKRTCHS